jgi:predicted membrane channel-forming protein YqfA (hemolysin III family)
VSPETREYKFVLGGIFTLITGVIFGYLNNARGGMAFWHVCVLAASVVAWYLIYDQASLLKHPQSQVQTE